MMADAARWFLEKNLTSGNDWSKTVAAAVWHGGALTDTDLDISEGNLNSIFNSVFFAKITYCRACEIRRHFVHVPIRKCLGHSGDDRFSN